MDEQSLGVAAGMSMSFIRQALGDIYGLTPVVQELHASIREDYKGQVRSKGRELFAELLDRSAVDVEIRVNKREDRAAYLRLHERIEEYLRLCDLSIQRNKDLTFRDVDVQIMIGDMYEKGDRIRKSAEKAIMWFERAATQGDAYSFWRLSRFYMLGEGVAKNPKRAVSLLEDAAALGDKKSIEALIQFYLHGNDLVFQDYAAAVYYLQKSAMLGNSSAQSQLGFMYAKGEE